LGFITATNPWQRNAPGDDSIGQANFPGLGTGLKLGAASFGVLRNIKRAEETFEVIEEMPLAAQRFLASGRETQVYLGYRDGKAVYCGISCNVARRDAQHGTRFKAEAFTQMMPRGQARAIEQAMILRNPQFDNMRNSI